jgi:outer membrane protein assembly factor BamB
MRKNLILLAVIAAAALASVSSAEDGWPQFRGPGGQGLSEARDVPLKWSATEHVAWKHEIPGSGWSSPAVAGGRVFLTSAVPAKDAAEGDLSLRALCFDAATGQSIWDVEVFREVKAKAPGIHSKNSHASPTPIVDGKEIYVHFGHQGIARLAWDGSVVWRNTELKYPPVHGNGGSPALVGDRLIFSCDGASEPFVAAVSRKDGKTLWKTERKGDSAKKFAFSTPLAIEVDGKTQIISPGAGSVGAFDPESGREIWRVNYDGYSVIPRPVFGHGMIYISTGYDTPVVMAIRAGGKGDMTESNVAWKLAKGAPNTPSLLLVGDELYMVSDKGVASCVDAKTGKVVWQNRVGGNFSASPVFAEGKIYLQDEEGKGVVLKAGRKFEKLAECNVGERTLASIAVVDGAVFLRGDKHLFRFTAAASAPVASAARVAKGK